MARAKKSGSGRSSKDSAEAAETSVETDATGTPDQPDGNGEPASTPASTEEATAFDETVQEQPQTLEAHEGEPKEDSADADDGPGVAEVGDREAGADQAADETALAPSEPETAAEPDRPAQEAAPPTPPASSGSGRGFVGGLLGGALAAAGAFGIVLATNPDILQPPEPSESVSLAPLTEGLAEQAGRGDALEQELQSLRGEIETLREAAPQPNGDTGRLDEVETALAERIDSVSSALESVSSALEALDARVTQVEARPPVIEGGEAEAAAAQAVSDMRAALDAQRAEIAALAEEAQSRIAAAEEQAQTLRSETEAAARAATARSSLSLLQAALDAGGPYAGALSDLSGVTDASIPEMLVTHADTGIPTLAELQRSFPDAARAGLAAAVRTEVGEDAGAMDRIGAFLRAQTGARSITPRDGDSADAVLSRAEAALMDGQLSQTLMLLTDLPAEAQAAMADWQTRAQVRADALSAAETLSASLTGQ